MFDKLIDGVGSVIPFVAPYPLWVKGLFAVFVLSGALFFISLVVAAPNPVPVPPVPPPTKAWLVIRGVTMFGGTDSKAVRVTATINGQRYIYPSLPGIEWAEVEPDMASQDFEIPALDNYNIRFEAAVKDQPNVRLASVEEQHIQGSTGGIRTYALHQVEGGTRAAQIEAEVKYTIERR